MYQIYPFTSFTTSWNLLQPGCPFHNSAVCVVGPLSCATADVILRVGLHISSLHLSPYCTPLILLGVHAFYLGVILAVQAFLNIHSMFLWAFLIYAGSLCAWLKKTPVSMSMSQTENGQGNMQASCYLHSLPLGAFLLYVGNLLMLHPLGSAHVSHLRVFKACARDVVSSQG